MEIAKKIASNTFSQVFARFFNAFVSILIVRIITGYLAAEGYGRYTIVYSFIAFFDIAADLGLFTIAVSEMSKAGDFMAKGRERISRAEHILGNVLSLRLLLVVILGTLASIAVLFFPGYAPELQIAIMIAAAGMALNHLGITLSSALQVHYKMPLNAIAIAVSKLVMLAMIYYVAKADLGFIMLIVAGLINNALILVITYLFSIRYMRVRLYADFKEWKRLLGKTIVYGISLICGAFFIYFSPLVLNSYGTEADVGIYGVANKIVQLLIIIPFAFMNSALPSISRNLENPPRLHDIIRNAFDFIITLGFGMLVGTVILADNIIQLASSGDDFVRSGPILQILVFGVFFLFLHNLFSYLLLAVDRQKTLLKITIVAAITSIVANFILIPLDGTFGGMTGAAIASVIPQAIVLIGTYWSAKRILKFNLSYGNALKVIIAGLGMGVALWLFDTYAFLRLHTIIKLALEVPLGLIVFFMLLLILGGISPQALDILLRRTGGTAPVKKKIAIDIRAIAADKTGKEWYTLNILEALAHIDHENDYILYTRYRVPYTFGPNFHVRRIRLPLVLWHPAMMLDMWVRKVDVLFAPASYIAPSLCFFRRLKPIVVIHDAVAFLFPRKHQLKARIIEKYTVGLALKHARAIVAVSEHTKRDIVRLFGITPERVTVIGEAARSNFTKITDTALLARTRDKYHIPEKFILFVGTLEPRKNLRTLLHAYAQLPDRSEYKLVIVGKKGWYYSEIFKTIKQLHLSTDVIFTGYIPDEDLPAILNAATVFVMPSLYEGFGLPLLEAFSCGTPVVTSNSSALFEIARDVCIMVDPLSIEELRAGLHTALTDPTQRDTMIRAGFARVGEYSWGKAARQLHALIINL